MNLKVRQTLPIILSIVGSGGVIATTLLAIKATPKANKLLDENKDADKLTKIKKVLPVYLPTILTGTATIASIVSSTIISKKTEASLSAACLMIDQGYRKYQGKVKELLGIDKHTQVIESIAKDDCDRLNPEKKDDGTQLYWNKYVGFFRATPYNLERAIANMNMRLNALNSSNMFDSSESGWCTLEQFIEESHMEMLEKEKYKESYMYGWTEDYLKEAWDDNWIYYGTHEEATKAGETYTVIEFMTAEPIFDPVAYEDYSYAEAHTFNEIGDPDGDVEDHEYDVTVSKNKK